MSLRDRLAPAVYDLMGGPIEKKPLIVDNRRGRYLLEHVRSDDQKIAGPP